MTIGMVITAMLRAVKRWRASAVSYSTRRSHPPRQGRQHAVRERSHSQTPFTPKRLEMLRRVTARSFTFGEDGVNFSCVS
jgi:hypothetical protein